MGSDGGFETSFRDIKDMRFGMGLSAMRVSIAASRPFVAAQCVGDCIAVVVGRGGGELGVRPLAEGEHGEVSYAFVVRQGLMLYEQIPNWPDERVWPLMERFSEMLMEQRVFKEIFGVI